MDQFSTTPDDNSQQLNDNEFSTLVLKRVDAIIQAAEQAGQPLELDPARTDLFKLFAAASARNLVGDEASPDLSADGICQTLSSRWGLQEAAQNSVSSQTRLAGEQLAQMRSLWSVMRMWMEWTYAWERWPEHHGQSTASETPAAD